MKTKLFEKSAKATAQTQPTYYHVADVSKMIHKKQQLMTLSNTL